MMESNVFRILPFLFSLINYIKCGATLPPTQSLYCTDLNPQNNIDIESVSLIQFPIQFFSLINLCHNLNL